MGSRPDGWWRDRPAARRRLVAELVAAGPAVLREADLPPGSPVVVVFDGRPHPLEADGADVRFAPHADDALVALARPGDVLATSDRELAARASSAGARTVGAGRIARALRG